LCFVLVFEEELRKIREKESKDKLNKKVRKKET